MSSTTEGVDAITQFLSYPFDKDDAFQVDKELLPLRR